MNYLYHSVPADISGDTLYPLNQLKEHYPELYKEKIKKYDGRESQLEMQVFPLNCLWNDVLHFSPIHPNEVKQALIDAGDTKNFSLSFYKIDPHSLDPEKTTVFLYNRLSRPFSTLPEDFVEYNPDQISEFSHYKQANKDYFKRSFVEGNKRPLLFHLVPHILYKGTININGLPIVTA